MKTSWREVTHIWVCREEEISSSYNVREKIYVLCLPVQRFPVYDTERLTFSVHFNAQSRKWCYDIWLGSSKKLSLFIHALMFSIDSSGIKIVLPLCDYSIYSFAAYYSSTIERNIFYLRQINKSIYPFKYATKLLMNYNSELEHCYKVIENIRRYFYIPDVGVYLTSKFM